MFLKPSAGAHGFMTSSSCCKTRTSKLPFACGKYYCQAPAHMENRRLLRLFSTPLSVRPFPLLSEFAFAVRGSLAAGAVAGGTDHRVADQELLVSSNLACHLANDRPAAQAMLWHTNQFAIWRLAHAQDFQLLDCCCDVAALPYSDLAANYTNRMKKLQQKMPQNSRRRCYEHTCQHPVQV